MGNTSESLSEIGKRINAAKETLKDRGSRRHVSWGMEFDSRALILTQNIDEHWEKTAKEQWRINQEQIREDLGRQFGELEINVKIENFISIGSKPISILSYHNQFFSQVRQAFIVGAYYPALVGACALGERVLNHLIIDLRDFYSSRKEYKRVYRKKSFDDWNVPIDTLSAWGVLLPDVAKEFRLLKILRDRSIHFNEKTYSTQKEDSLNAILRMRKIIEIQFGSYGSQPWFIKGTKGHKFISKEWEENPFVQTYFLRNCPFVGPLFSVEHSENGWEFFDFHDYGEDQLTDEEFANKFNSRSPEVLARRPEIQENIEK